MTEPRPDKMTPEIALSVARRIASALAEHGLIDKTKIEGHAEDIAEQGHQYMDGYELAKDLEHFCYWDCTLEMANILDSFRTEARREITAVEKEWAEHNAIVPPLPDGTRVKINRDGETGQITGVQERAVAKYLIAIDGDTDAEAPMYARRVVNFEDVQAI